MQAMRERAGLATSLGTKPLSAPFGLFAVAKLHYAKMSSRVAAARKLALPPGSKGPAKSELIACVGAVARLLTNQARPLLLANQECPHFRQAAVSSSEMSW